LPSPSLKTKIVKAKAATRNITLAGFECTEVIETPESVEDGPVDPTTPSPHLGSPMEQRDHDRGCHETPLSFGIGLGRL
jgi:hypothetical protein